MRLRLVADCRQVLQVEVVLFLRLLIFFGRRLFQIVLKSRSSARVVNNRRLKSSQLAQAKCDPEKSVIDCFLLR